jgi:hypothetical protein
MESKNQESENSDCRDKEIGNLIEAAAPRNRGGHWFSMTRHESWRSKSNLRFHDQKYQKYHLFSSKPSAHIFEQANDHHSIYQDWNEGSGSTSIEGTTQHYIVF